MQFDVMDAYGIISLYKCGDYVCATTESSEIIYWDLKKSSKPKFKELKLWIKDEFVYYKNFAYVLSGVGVTVIDMSDPANPKTLTKIVDDAGFSNIIFIHDGKLVTFYNSGCLIFWNLDDPAHPSKEKIYESVTLYPFHNTVRIKDNYIFQLNEDEIKCIDLGRPTEIKWVANVNDEFAYMYEIYDNCLYASMAGMIQCWDIGNNPPKLINTLNCPDVYEIFIHEGNLFTVCKDILICWNISDPFSPRSLYKMKMERLIFLPMVDLLESKIYYLSNSYIVEPTSLELNTIDICGWSPGRHYLYSPEFKQKAYVWYWICRSHGIYKDIIFYVLSLI